MKKVLVILFALGLVFAFSAPAMATDIEVSGSYYARGWYDANSSLNEQATSNALYQQRLRIYATFKVAPGLKLMTKMDALELAWGANVPAGQNGAGPLGTTVGYTNEQSAWSVETSKLQFATKVGLFQVGIWDTNTWGCDFGNNSWSTGSIQWIAPVGKLLLIAKLEKNVERDTKAINGDAYSDLDSDNWLVAAVYRNAGLEAGLLFKYIRSAVSRDLIPGVDGYLVTFGLVTPYFKLKSGNLYAEGQFYYGEGELEGETGVFVGDTDLEGLSAYLMGKVKLDAFTVGALAAYAQGDDPDSDTLEGFALNGGWDWNPCLILWNDDFNYKADGYLGHVNGAATDGMMRNAYIYQVFMEMAPSDKVAVKASFSYAKADEKPVGFEDDKYGTEFDISASYKIYDNLDYMVGFGYLWAGDYYKGTNSKNVIDDTYLLVNKLTLSF